MNYNNRNEEHPLNQDEFSARTGGRILEDVRSSKTAAPTKAITNSTKSGEPRNDANGGKRVKRIKMLLSVHIVSDATPAELVVIAVGLGSRRCREKYLFEKRVRALVPTKTKTHTIMI